MISHKNRKLKLLFRPKFNSYKKINKLFLSKIDVDRNPRKVVIIPQLVLNKTLVRIFYILWQVGKKHKLWRWGWQLHAVFNFHIFPFKCRWRGALDNREHHFIEF